MNILIDVSGVLKSKLIMNYFTIIQRFNIIFDFLLLVLSCKPLVNPVFLVKSKIV